MEAISENSPLVVIITVIVSVLTLIFTRWGVVSQVRKNIDDEKDELEEWKTKREITDTEQNDHIKSNAEKIKAHALILEEEKRKREELDKRFQNEIASIQKLFYENKENLKEELIKAIKSFQPILKEQEKSIVNTIKVLLDHNKELNSKEFKALWNELNKKTNKRAMK